MKIKLSGNEITAGFIKEYNTRNGVSYILKTVEIMFKKEEKI